MDSVDDINPIEETIDFESCQNYLDMYYLRKFQLDTHETHNNLCLLIHSNRLCVLVLAPSHPIVRDQIKIASIDFQVSKNVNRLQNVATGKRKRNAQYISNTSPVCFIECCNGLKFTISSPIPGKLLEINEKLTTNPNLLNLPFDRNYHTECFIAVLTPNHNTSIEELTKNLSNQDEYDISIRNENTTTGRV